MAGLCIADIDRWSVGDIGRVFGICSKVADHCDETSLILANLDAFSTWTGDAAEAAKDSVHKTRVDLDRSGEVAKKVAEAARKAEQEILSVRQRLTDLRTEATLNGLAIDGHTDTVYEFDPPDMKGWPEADKAAYAREIADLQFRVNTLIVAAATADHDLANAIKAADGEEEDFSWKPSAKEITLGGVAGGTAAETDLLRGIWQTAIGDNPSKLDSRILPWLKEIGESKNIKGLSRAGGVVAVLTAVPSVIADVGDGNNPLKAVAREGAGAAAGVAFGAATSSGIGAVFAAMGTGAEAGAVGGSVVPGAGTVVGAIAGAVVGAGAAWGASKGIDWLWDD